MLITLEDLDTQEKNRSWVDQVYIMAHMAYPMGGVYCNHHFWMIGGAPHLATHWIILASGGSATCGAKHVALFV